jgi:RNA polymerase sigma-70 factor (ECF subfamily)
MELTNKEERFLNLLNTHRGIIYRLVKVYARSPADQEDLAQEMALQLWRSFDHFLGKSQFSTWMYRVCLNTALSHYKSIQRPTIVPIEEISIGSDQVGTDHHEERLALLYQHIQGLPLSDRAVVFLYLEGLSGQEIAKSLGISEVNTRVRLTRIKDRLKKQLAAYGYEL